jgi:multiple antibiotic resistance protein
VVTSVSTLDPIKAYFTVSEAQYLEWRSRFPTETSRWVGKTGMIVIVMLSSFLLVCIGVQIMWNGLSALLSTLHM